MIDSILYVKLVCLSVALCLLPHLAYGADKTQWSESEREILKMQWLGSLPTLPPDTTNQYAENYSAARLGHKIFFDTRFSRNGKVSCATCHVPEKFFTDDLARAKGVGVTKRSTPSIIGIAYSPWFFWDGSSDSLWSQALSPLESEVEHGGNRMQYARLIFGNPEYRKTYQDIFGQLPDLSDHKRFPPKASPTGHDEYQILWNAMSSEDQTAVTTIFVNISKAIAAYERLLLPSESRFDRYVTAVLNGKHSNALTQDEIDGLKLFIGKGMCVTCHQGPMFTNHGFHNVGAPDPASGKQWRRILKIFVEQPLFDVGRYLGVKKVMASEFNCLGNYSDAVDYECAELKYANTKPAATLGAFKVPTLRNIAATAPYFHLGQFATLGDVLAHYNEAPDAAVGHSELVPLGLDNIELAQLEAFLHSLASPPAVAADWLRASQ